VFIAQVLDHRYFDDFIYNLIGLNSILLMIDYPIITDAYTNNTLDFIGTVISIIFVVEAGLKIVAKGFVLGPDSYLKDSWNILDFLIVLSAILSWILTAYSSINLAFMRGFRALRALRPLRIISKDEGMKTVINSLLRAIPNLFTVSIIYLFTILVFAILGVQLFSGEMSSCSDDSISTKAECVGFDSDGNPREWVTPFNNFNNVFFGMITLFELTTFENWNNTIVLLTQTQGVDLGPAKDPNGRPIAALFFIGYLFISAFFEINLFVSVIVDKFNEEIKRRQGSENFTDEQKEWVKMQRLMLHVNLKTRPTKPRSNSRLRLLAYKLVQHRFFDKFIMFTIVLNTLFLFMDYEGNTVYLQKTVKYGNIAFISIFGIEAILKFVGHGPQYYFLDTWNRFDFLIVVLSLIAIDEDIFKFKITALRIVRVARLLKLVKSSKGLKNLLKALWLSLKSIVSVATILFIVFFSFAVAGMQIFGNMDVTVTSTMNGDANFQTFYLALTTLFRCTTGESWNLIMHDCYD